MFTSAVDQFICSGSVRWCAFIPALLFFSTATAGAAAAASPPPTSRDAVATTMHGVTVRDPYRWLEAAGSPKVQAWIDAQNAYADSVMGQFKDAAAITRRVRQLAITSTAQYAPQLVHGTLFFMRETPPQAQPVLVAQAWPSGPQRVLVDTNPSGGNVAVQEVWPSPSGRYVAYGTSANGSEATTIHVGDAVTGKALPDALTDAGGGTTGPVVAWDADEHGMTYGRLPHGSLFGIALYHHSLGTPQTSDRAEFGQGLSPIAEYELLSSPDAKEVAALVQFGDATPFRVYLRSHDTWRQIFGPGEGVTAGAFDGDRLLLASFGKSDHGRIVAVSADGKVSTLVPQQKNWVMQNVSPIQGGFLVTKLWGPDWRVDQYASDGRFVRRVPLPPTGIGIDAIASEAGSAEAVVDYSGWTIPTRWGLYDAKSGSLRTIFAVRPPDHDYANIRTYRLTAISQDGARIPVTVLALASTPKRSDNPAILTAYGGYDIPVAPQFIGTDLAWLERGGVYAMANIRGGDEFGESWHREGRLTSKQNVFDDFTAAAQALVSAGWTSPRHFGIVGGSNGGLLMGAALTQHPELYHAVVSYVGIYDTLRHELYPNGRYNVGETGSVVDAAQFHALYAYAPYYNVHPGARYPAVLLETGENDPRVAPWQSRKFAAALQTATASSLPVLLLTRRAAGHGNIGASFSQRVGNAAATLIFFDNELR
ncbi:MAG TPA: prolyl oligopeptidase family serine peptidase [Steroidobacteraceae bacterium]|nr:prolyl oligopeptidase family serine peptidase [Steroidobacteraceae bacterium]